MWTQQAVRWMQMEKWDKSKGEVDRKALRGMECCGGLDLAQTKDVAAFLLAFEIDGFVKWLPFFWIPEENIKERVQRHRIPYDEWVRLGLVKATPGDVIDYDYIEKEILELNEEFSIRQVGFDPWSATQIIQHLGDEGMDMVPIAQTTGGLTAPTKGLEVLVLQKRLHHAAHPVLRWMASNMVVWRDCNDNVRPDKANSTSKIDGIVAGIMANDRLFRKEGVSRSPYEDRGLIIIGGGS